MSGGALELGEGREKELHLHALTPTRQQTRHSPESNGFSVKEASKQNTEGAGDQGGKEEGTRKGKNLADVEVDAESLGERAREAQVDVHVPIPQRVSLRVVVLHPPPHAKVRSRLVSPRSRLTLWTVVTSRMG
eukprot:3872441-Rhodomonas_salina.1